MKFKMDRVMSGTIIGVTLAFLIQTILFGVFGLLWVGLLIDLLPIGFAVVTICSLYRYMKKVKAGNEKMKAYTKYNDIRYMTKQQYDTYREKGYIVTDDGIAIIKENIEEVIL
jgi:uncharacterized membrane protein